MKKTLRKVLVSILAAVMVLCAAPLSGIADIDFSEMFTVRASALASSGSCGENVTYTFDSSKGLLIISGTGIMDEVSTFQNNSSIKTVIIEYGVTEICRNCFEDCVNLSDVTLPDSLTVIGARAFSGCYSLTDITIPDGVKEIRDAAFKYCIMLTDITIPDSVTKIGEKVFDYCNLITSITIPASVKTIKQYAFNNNLGLKEIIVDENNSNYSSDENGVLFDKKKTKLIRFPPDSDVADYSVPSTVTSIYNYGFYKCRNLVSVTIPTGVKSISHCVFMNCSSLSHVTIPDSVGHLGRSSFRSCVSLTEITIPESVTNIDSAAFYDCINLQSITIPKNVEEINEGVFRYCDSLVEINVDKNNAYYTNDENGALFSKDKTRLIQFPSGSDAYYYSIPESVTAVERFAFNNCSGLTNVTVPDSVESIGDCAFENVINITYHGSLKYGPWGAMYCNKYADGYMLFDDEEKTDLLFCNRRIKGEAAVPGSVTNIRSNAFSDCDGITALAIPPGVTSIGNSAFKDCVKLTVWCCAGSYIETYAVNNNIPFEYITLNLSESVIIASGSEQVAVDASFNIPILDNEEITWTSDNTEIAAVQNGTVNILDAGEAKITASGYGGVSASCIIKVDLKLDPAADAVIDRESGIVFGPDMMNNNAEGIRNLFINSRVSVADNNGIIGTGSKVSLYQADGTVYREIEIVIFGDVNGDGRYDGTDSTIVNCIANGLLSREQVGEAVYRAADCNHDDVIDENDVALLEQAGVILASVDQSKSPGKLVEDSAYIEYMNLIDQNPTDYTPVIEPAEGSTGKSFFKRVLDFIIHIIHFLKSFFTHDKPVIYL